MSNFATATLMGRLGKNPETRQTQNGKEVASFSLAVNTGYGENQITTWWNVVCFGKTAEIASKYLKKGSSALFDGEPVLEKFKDRDGNERQSLKLVCNRLVLLGERPKDEDESPTKAPKKISTDAPFDDDIPF